MKWQRKRKQMRQEHWWVGDAILVTRLDEVPLLREAFSLGIALKVDKVEDQASTQPKAERGTGLRWLR